MDFIMCWCIVKSSFVINYKNIKSFAVRSFVVNLKKKSRKVDYIKIKEQISFQRIRI